MAHWRYYRDNTGALVDMAYAKHAAHLLHRVTHNHQPEVREAAAIRIKEAQMARNTCPRWILAQHGVSTSVGTGIWAQLQLPLPHHTRHPDKPPLRSTGATRGHEHRHPPTPGRRGGHPAPRGGHRHHGVYHPNTDEDHGPMRRRPRPVPFRPTMASTPRLPSVPPRMCYEGRARYAGAQGHRHGVHSLPAPAPPAPPERARDPQRRRHDAGGAHPVSRRLDTTHHPATSTKRPQTCYPHCPATPCPLVHPQTQCTGDRCTTSQTQ